MCANLVNLLFANRTLCVYDDVIMCLALVCECCTLVGIFCVYCVYIVGGVAGWKVAERICVT